MNYMVTGRVDGDVVYLSEMSCNQATWSTTEEAAAVYACVGEAHRDMTRSGDGRVAWLGNDVVAVEGARVVRLRRRGHRTQRRRSRLDVLWAHPERAWLEKKSATLLQTSTRMTPIDRAAR
jgi:hypothetical protein